MKMGRERVAGGMKVKTVAMIKSLTKRTVRKMKKMIQITMTTQTQVQVVTR